MKHRTYLGGESIGGALYVGGAGPQHSPAQTWYCNSGRGRPRRTSDKRHRVSISDSARGSISPATITTSSSASWPR